MGKSHRRMFILGKLSDKPFNFKEVTWKIRAECIPEGFVDEDGIYDEGSHEFSFAGAYWFLHIGRSPSRLGWIEMVLERLDDSEVKEHNIWCRTFFKTCSGKEFNPVQNSFVFTDENDCGHIFLMKERAFLQNKNCITMDDEVTLVCQIRIDIAETRVFPLSTESSVVNSYSTLDSNFSDLSHDTKVFHDFKELFLNKEGCDVIIKVKGIEFHAHRTILTARSPVFASTFATDKKENSPCIVDVEDCDPSTFSTFLCFLYCGEIENLSPENAPSLFIAADMFDVPDLRAKCLNIMKQSLSVDNFCDIIALASQYYEIELFELSTNFFMQNLQKIIVSAKWQHFVIDNPILSNELLIKTLVTEEK